MAVNEPLPSVETNITQAQKPRSGTVAHDLIINVLGTRFSITAGEDLEYLDEVLAQYRFAVVNTQNISGMKDPLQVAILTGFLLCDEINKMKLQIKEEQTYSENELNRIIKRLAARVDQLLVKETDPKNDGILEAQ
jgi:cell division protein ZapA (FtsZ GTPase activity inhibitor)